MQLVIAEKPSVARDIARVLGMRGTGRHALADSTRVITWCVGHLVELDEPAAYDARWKPWRLDALPMLPAVFKLRPVEGSRAQLEAVQKLLRERRFTEVVNACDAGREGELIFRYVYELSQSRLAVRRLWISSMTDESIRRGFANLRPGADYDALGDAARCRSEADWLVGLNATRAVTVTQRAARPDRSPVYSIGRVQTPTLAIVVRREQAIEAFRPQDYWEVRATFTPLGDASTTTSFAATWEIRSEARKGGVTRLGQAGLAEAIVQRTRLASAALPDEGRPVVESLRQKKSREPAPQLFDLTSLQRTANRRFGLSATRTLEAAQALYEKHKLLTYPRTDSRHLTGDLFDELPRLFRGAAELADYAPYARALLVTPPSRSKRVFDDAKVQDHHAIIPTGKGASLESLSLDERRVFDLVMRRFLGVFYPDAEFALTAVVVRVGAAAESAGSGSGFATNTARGRPPSPAVSDLQDRPEDRPGDLAEDGPEELASNESRLQELPPPPDRFFARGRVRLVAGWQEVAQLGGELRRPEPARSLVAPEGVAPEGGREAEPGGEPASTLPPLFEGQRLIGTFEVAARQTKPPPRHTEASLLGAMESAGRDIEDETLRAAMKDTGLGTPATRAATIETLVRRGFVARQGKLIVPTPMGMELIRTLPVVSLASPELTGAWEARLARIARGQEARAVFMADISRYVREVVDAIRRRPQSPERQSASTPVQSGLSKSSAPQPPPSVLPSPSPSPPPSPPSPLSCPRCKKGTLVTGKRGWGCSGWRDGCPFVVWFETAGRRVTPSELRDLVQKGKTRKGRWSPAGGPRVSGRLVLDTAGGGSSGAGRFEPA